MILAQLELAVTTQELLLDCPFDLTVSQINFANSTGASISVRLWIVKANETLANKHRYAYDVLVPANDRAVLTDELPLELSDRLYVYASATGITAHVFGSAD